VDAINATHPNIILYLGDLINFNDEEVVEFLPQLSRLKAKDGVVSIMGNHDYMSYQTWKDSTEQARRVAHLQDMQRQMGWKLLLNEHLTIRHPQAPQDSIVIIGSENDSRPPLPQRGNLPKAMAGTSSTAFRILLTHDPSHWRRSVVGKTDIPLTFSGHTHGMQMALPGGWSPVSFIYKEWGGAYTDGEQRLYVTTGIGTALLPMRIGVPPEVVTCILKRVK